MDQFVLSLLLGGFFSILVLTLQYLFDLHEDLNIKLDIVEPSYDYEVNVPYCSNVFRDPRNHPWMFTDAVMSSIINYFRNELTSYRRSFTPEESIELSHILYDKTFIIEKFFRETKRGKIDHELFNQIVTADFAVCGEEKQFLLRSVFKEAHNGLIEDLIAGRLNVRK